MNLRDYLQVLRHRWAVIVVLALLGLGTAAALTFSQPPEYEATTRLFVSAGGGGEGVDQAYQGGLFAQQRVRSYLEVVRSPDVLQPVREQLDLRNSLTQLRERVRASSPLDTVLIDVSVVAPDPEEAAALADATAERFARYIEELESRSGEQLPPVKATVVEPASVPTDPISPSVRINLALGLLAGLALGVGAAFLRESLDTTVRSTAATESIVKAPVLGDIPFDSSTKKQELLSEMSRSARSEAFRGLRTNLQYVDVDRPPSAVVVTSSLAGEGKSHTSANLALALARSGKRILLLEGDLRRPGAVKLFDLVEGAGLTNVLVGSASAEEVIQHVGNTGLDVLPCGSIPPNPSELLGSHRMELLLDDLKRTYDTVIIDTPPLLPVTDAAVLARAADGAVVVVRRSKTKREELSAAVASLEAVNARVLGAVMNMSPASRGGPSPYLKNDSSGPAHKPRIKAATSQPIAAA